MCSIRMTSAVLNQIRETLGKLPPEHGGVLGMDQNGVISAYHFDADGASTATGYSPNVDSINRVLADDWMPRGTLMAGIVHSHAPGLDAPSCMDVGYGVRILQALDTVDRFYLPIVTTSDDGFRITCYAILKEGDAHVCRKVDLAIED